MLGVDKAYLYERMDLGPAITMNYMPKNQMLSFLASIDVKVLNLEITQNNVMYYVTKWTSQILIWVSIHRKTVTLRS